MRRDMESIVERVLSLLKVLQYIIRIH